MGQRQAEPPENHGYADGTMVGRPSTRKPSEFGKRLISLREERGLTQAELAKLIGITQQQVTYYERRARNPSIELVRRAAAALDVPVTALLPGADDGAKGQPRRRGRPSEFEERWERVRQLPRSEQQHIIEMIDVAIERAERRANA